MTDPLAVTGEFRTHHGADYDSSKPETRPTDTFPVRHGDVTFSILKNNSGNWIGTKVFVDGIHVATMDVSRVPGVEEFETTWLKYSANLRDHVWAAAKAIHAKVVTEKNERERRAAENAQQKADKEAAFDDKWGIE